MNDNIEKESDLGIRCRIERNENLKVPESELDRDETADGYQLKWVGKNYAKLLSGKSPETVIESDEEHNKKPLNMNSENILFTGDNLEVLRHMRNAYYKSIDVIYIDPPYNTGNENDFVYRDKFDFTDDELEEKLGMREDDIERLKSIRGRSSHSAWLTFIYPRLRLAKSLLKETGVIFISIDDNEQANLKLLCDEVFGEANFVNTFTWVNNLKGRQISHIGAAKTNEYILCYAKDANQLGEFVFNYEYLKRIMPSSYKGFDYEMKKDDKGEYYITNELYNTNSAFNEITRPKLVFDIYYNPATKEIITEDVSESESPNLHEGFVKISPHRNADGTHKYHAYRWSREKIKNESYDLEFLKVGNSYKVFTKRRTRETTLKDLITDISTTQGANDMERLFGNRNLFSFPKPTELLKVLINSINTPDPIVLDFFAGSGTTAEAVMNLNASDGGKRKFILVQLDEEVKKKEVLDAGYKTIDEITKERIIRAGERIKAENSLLGNDVDLGFKHYYVKELSEVTIDKIKEFDPAIESTILIKDDMLGVMGGVEAILNTYRLMDGSKLTDKVERLTLSDYVAYLASSKVGKTLYILESGWDTEETRELLNLIGTGKLEINTIVLFGYSMTFKAEKELRLGVRQALGDKDIDLSIQKRW